VIELGALLAGFAATSDPHASRLLADGPDGRLEINPDGRGADFRPLATLDGARTTSIETLLASGQLDLGGG
jgi:hypothetical protein